MRGPDALILDLAARYHGVVTRAQLLARGISRDQIATRVRRGLLMPQYRGVYLAGAVADAFTVPLAACLACGRTAVASERTAGGMWGVMETAATVLPMVTVVNVTRCPGNVHVRPVRALPNGHITRLQGVPVTTPMRTLLDLAALLPTRELERALGEACARRLTTERRMRQFIGANGTARGAAALRRLLEAGPRFTASQAEELMLARVRSAELPTPRTNAWIRNFKVDFLWTEQRLVVEVDGSHVHNTRRGFEDDRRRDATLLADGYRVMRVTWRQLESGSDAMLVRLAQALVQR